MKSVFGSKFEKKKLSQHPSFPKPGTHLFMNINVHLFPIVFGFFLHVQVTVVRHNFNPKRLLTIQILQDNQWNLVLRSQAINIIGFEHG